jgi:hypothetical protein
MFAAITYDERMKFFKAWAELHTEDKYLAYDVTSLSSYAKGIEDTEWGYIAVFIIMYNSYSCEHFYLANQ